MIKTLCTPTLGGEIKAISSKSMAHRLLICAAFADRECEISCENTNADICATADCLSALGASIERWGSVYRVSPLRILDPHPTLNCGESGSTLRCLLPVAAALGADASIYMSGRLPQRPLSPLYEELTFGGADLSPQGTNPLLLSGKLRVGDYRVAANISSQFVSGLMFALPLIDRFGGDGEEGFSTLTLTHEIESAPYIDMTLDALASFGVSFLELTPNGENKTRKYLIQKSAPFRAPYGLSVEGDWSNAAFWLAAGAIGKERITVKSLNTSSRQGDMQIADLLKRFGAGVIESGDCVTVIHRQLHGIRIDASQIPDLVPILAVVASVSEGETVIYGASRLKLKESDRLLSVSNMLKALGADIIADNDKLIIRGRQFLDGGEVSSENDHRIAMAAAIASTVCRGEVKINGAEAVAKSYPDFWNDFERLGK